MSLITDQISFKNFKHCIDFYRQFAIHDNEYQLRINKNGDVITTHAAFFNLQGNGICSDVSDDRKLLTLTDHAIQRFHPNNINNKEFWKYAKTKFPLFSVCGGMASSIEEVNEKTLSMPQSCGFINHIDYLIKSNKRKLNFFEIGYGHGNMFFKYNDLVNYIGIDYAKHDSLKHFTKLRLIKKSGIPNFIKDESQDIIYSVNVLQHCSQVDRFAYLKQAYKKLKKGGVFFGSCFIVTKENRNNSELWGQQDSSGRLYCNFFNQLTEVDTIEELLGLCDDIGYLKVHSQVLGGNTLFFTLKKI